MRRGRVSAIIVATLALSGCGGRRTAAPAGSGVVAAQRLQRGIDPSVRFRGRRVAGTLFVVAGPGGSFGSTARDMDVYVIRGAFAKARRLTYSKGPGFDLVVASGSDVLVSDGRDVLAGDEIRQLRIRGRSASLGPILGHGAGLQAVGGGGRFLYKAFYDPGSGDAAYWKVFEARVGRPGGRPVARTPTTVNGDVNPWAGWGLDGRIAVLLGDRVILDAGSQTPDSVRGVSGYSYLVGGGPGGLLALHGSGKIGLLSRDAQLRVVKTSWFPMCFSPDGRDLVVVNSRWDRLALMSVASGALSPLGSVAGHLNDVAWVAG